MAPSDALLDKYAELAVRVGVNLQPGQTLMIGAGRSGTSVESADFIRRVVAKAYDAGAWRVYVNWEDEQVTRLTIERAPVEALSDFPTPLATWFEEAAEQNAAFIHVMAPDPGLLDGIDPARISAFRTAQLKALARVGEYSSNMRINWTGLAVATPAWAAKVFPDLPTDEQMDTLWSHILHAVRVTEEGDAVKAWQEHAQRLAERTDSLNRQQFKRLHYRAPGTDLAVDLPPGHLWIGGGSRNSRTNLLCVPNMPTEEVFSVPTREGVNGTVSSTMPLNYNGVLIENMQLTFEHGRIVAYTADAGQDVLKGLIETDEGSHYLGEVALVPVDSPICRLNTLFYNTLFDENASCHFAIGRAYPICLEGGTAMSREQLAKAGANHSLTHVDFMIGSADLDIDGETAAGERLPLFRSGNWV